MLKADLHIHSNASFDCVSTPEAIIERCRAAGINCVAVADHGTAEGGLNLQKIAPFKVIVAEEILTPHGEVMGMFLKETIPTKIPVAEAIARIHDQGGLVCIPHPFDVLMRVGLGGKIMEEYEKDIDIIEVFNGRSQFPWRTAMSRRFAGKYDKARSAGTDAHTIGEIGKTYVEMPEFNGPEDFLQALREGKIHRHAAGPFVHFGSVKARFFKSKNQTAET